MWKCKCGEQNPDTSSFCQTCGTRKKPTGTNTPLSTTLTSIARGLTIQEERHAQDVLLKENKESFKTLLEIGHDGYWEYKVINMFDSNNGLINPDEITSQLNELGMQGWHLKCVYSNELGKNASVVGFGGISSGTNSTIDQNIFIFERFIKINTNTL